MNDVRPTLKYKGFKPEKVRLRKLGYLDWIRNARLRVYKFRGNPETSKVAHIRLLLANVGSCVFPAYAFSAPVYTAMPTTASTPSASRRFTSSMDLMPPATISLRVVAALRVATTSKGKPLIVPSVSMCV